MRGKIRQTENKETCHHNHFVSVCMCGLGGGRGVRSKVFHMERH